MQKKLAGGKDIMNKEQLGQLIIASEDTLYHVAKTLLSDDADCADAIQETILTCYEKLSSLKNNAYFKTWMIKILMRKCCDILSNKKILYFSHASKDQRFSSR